MSSAKNTIWLIEDNISYRGSVAMVLEDVENLECTQEFSSADTALKALETYELPDIILCDIGLPGMSGIEAVRKITSEYESVQVIMLTALDEDEKVFEAICGGASGYLLKSANEEEILWAIKQVIKGGSPMNAHIARKVLLRFAELNPSPNHYELTDREKDILKFLVDGTTKKAMALELDISFHTVDTHVRNIYEKLQVNSRSEAASKAVKERLI